MALLQLIYLLLTAVMTDPIRNPKKMLSLYCIFLLIYLTAYISTLQANFFDKKVLSDRSARVVVMMGMPAVINRWYFRAHSIKSLERNILGFVGMVYTTTLTISSWINGGAPKPPGYCDK